MSEDNQQQRIMKRLRSLQNDLGNVSVEPTKDCGTIDISHKLKYVADFQFKWTDGNHYVGYFVPPDGEKSHAIVSLWTGFDAVRFLVLYATLVELRAKRPSPL
jgi:hypothetical protein